MSPNICFSRLARSTFCQRPIRFPPERCAFSPPGSFAGFRRPRNLIKLRVRSSGCQPFEITGFPPVFNSKGSVHPDIAVRQTGELFLQRARKRASTWTRHKIRRRPKRKTIHKLKIAWRLCYSRKPFREPCPRMRTPERGQLEAYEIGCQELPRGFNRQAQTHSHLSSVNRLYQTPRHCARGE